MSWPTLYHVWVFLFLCIRRCLLVICESYCHLQNVIPTRMLYHLFLSSCLIFVHDSLLLSLEIFSANCCCSWLPSHDSSYERTDYEGWEKIIYFCYGKTKPFKTCQFSWGKLYLRCGLLLVFLTFWW